jgi:hypothetical protein
MVFHVASLIFANIIGTYIPASITMNELPSHQLGNVKP